ncbi:YdeI/OmpD-associated family protein [Sphingomonas sp.]|uniref:YdeI/OmpD-associated family protein n=1 Tax=Sphingomonas sp. TaxID=28214 RepID=UPI003CC69051
MTAEPPSRTFTVVPVAGELLEIRLPFDPKAVFGKARAPVVVTIGGYSYRSTIANMGDGVFVPLRRSHREAAGVVEGQPLTVTLNLDIAPRTIEAPSDLRAALEAAGAWERWTTLAYTHQREHVEAVAEAKRPTTRVRRIEQCVAMVAAM